MFEWCLRIIIVFCVLIPEVEIPPQDPRAQGPDFGSSEPLGVDSSPQHNTTRQCFPLSMRLMHFIHARRLNVIMQIQFSPLKQKPPL